LVIKYYIRVLISQVDIIKKEKEDLSGYCQGLSRLSMDRIIRSPGPDYPAPKFTKILAKSLVCKLLLDGRIFGEYPASEKTSKMTKSSKLHDCVTLWGGGGYLKYPPQISGPVNSAKDLVQFLLCALWRGADF
jgi:hypothetical protein